MNLNVISKLEIDYAETLYFDGSIRVIVNEYIFNLASQCNTDQVGDISYDNEDVELADVMTISKRIWMRMLDALARLDPEQICIEGPDINYNAEELYVIFRDIYKQSASNGQDFIQLEWF